MKSVMNHSFSQIPKADIPRSKFNRSFGLKTTLNAGALVPIFVDEVLPGDTLNLQTNLFGRMATPIVPIMDNIYLETFYFFVPNRLVWDNWKKFNGEQKNPGDSTDFLVPQIVAPGIGFPIDSLADHMGIPTGVPNLSVNALPFRAYSLIFNEWFRDQNLVNSVPLSTADGPDTVTNASSSYFRGKRHDYFTSCLPWPQKGPAVNIPLGSQAPVYGNVGLQASPYTVSPIIRNYAGATIPAGGTLNAAPNTDPITGVLKVGGSNVIMDPNGTLRLTSAYADLSAATSSTINALRQAFQIQKLYERDARGGTRYTELIRAHFGVVSPDARLQRPEYLGGGQTTINVHPIAQTQATGSTGATTPQGNLAAMATTSGRNGGFVKSFTEHGYVIGIANIRADLNYQKGLERFWSRKSRFDFYWPALSHIGEQAVLNKEIYAQGSANPTQDEAVFGYQERYAEYRYKPSQITGQFRSQAAQPLDIWHLAQNFTTLPTLSATFIADNPPINRVIAVPSQPHFLLDVYFNYNCARPMPTYSVPGLIDHF